MKVNSIQTTNSYYNQNKTNVSQKGNTTDSSETIVKSGPVPNADVTQFKKAIKPEELENPIKSFLIKLFGESKAVKKSSSVDAINAPFDWDTTISNELARIY